MERISLAVIAVSLGLACRGDNTPCSGTGCPQVGGTWAVTLGAAGGDGGDCAALGFDYQGGVLAITQNHAELTATFRGAGFEGLAYETREFTLNRNAGEFTDGGSMTESFHGRHSAVTDGGPGTLSGTYLLSARQQPQAGPQQTCDQIREFNATRP